MPANQSVLVDVGDRHAPVGSREWAIAYKLEAECCLKRHESDVKLAAMMLLSLKENEAWKPLGLLSWGMLLQQLGTTEDVADFIIAAKSGTVGDAIQAARDNPLPPPDATRNPAGTNQHTVRAAEAIKQAKDNPLPDARSSRGPTIPKQDRGINYDLRRLARDRPDLLDRVESGELSANAAAIEAGFRRKWIKVRADDYDAALAKINKHYGRETDAQGND